MCLKFALLVLGSCLATLEAATLYDQLTAINATTFLSLVDKANFQAMLQNQGPFTLLVPSNAAFARIPAAEMSSITPSQLTNILGYHIISGVHAKKEFLFGRHYYLNGTNGHIVRVYRTATGLHFNAAKATKIDVNATNGIIHVIDHVLDVPEGTVMDILGDPTYNLSKFQALVKHARLDTNYANPTGLNRYTVFAPSDAAMAAVPQSTMDKLNMDTTYLRMLVEYHVHSGTMHSRTLVHRHTVSTTLPAHNITVSNSTTGAIMLNGIATVTTSDIEAENGVVYVINHVLMPQILNPIVG